MERSLFGFILRYSKREQLLIVPLVVASMLIYFSMLDLPKAIINEAIQGKRFPEASSTVAFLKVHFSLPAFLGGAQVHLFDGFALHQLPYLLALTLRLPHADRGERRPEVPDQHHEGMAGRAHAAAGCATRCSIRSCASRWHASGA
jgi:hypothetical protein